MKARTIYMFLWILFWNMINLCQNNKGQTCVWRLVFLILFLSLNQLPPAKGFKKQAFPKNNGPSYFVRTLDYCISSYSFHRNYSFLNLEIVANSNICCIISILYLINWFFAAETIQGRKLYEEIQYFLPHKILSKCSFVHYC